MFALNFTLVLSLALAVAFPLTAMSYCTTECLENEDDLISDAEGDEVRGDDRGGDRQAVVHRRAASPV
jgi:hypothetical protein